MISPAGQRTGQSPVLKECLPGCQTGSPPITTASRDKRKGMLTRDQTGGVAGRPVWDGNNEPFTLKNIPVDQGFQLHQLMPHVDHLTKRARRRSLGQEQAFLASYHVSKLQGFCTNNTL